MNNNSNHYTDHFMIGFEQARELIFDTVSENAYEVISLADSSGRVLAKPIQANESLPPFNNTAMDGYAVVASDLKEASPEHPVDLKLAGITAAGELPSNVDDTQGTAWKIMTGAPVPRGYDSIIPVERTQLKNNIVSCYLAPKKGDHIRKIGEDFLAGETIGELGEIINSNSIMAYSAQGIDKVTVFARPSIAVFATGKELVDDPKAKLKPGQIRNSNKPFILNWLAKYPVELIDAGTNLDDAEQFENDLKQCLHNQVNIIISSGAVSMGDFDFIPQTIQKLGGEIIFHKSKIKPGKPILFAKFSNGSFYFGLPGNPISSIIGVRFFVSTALRKMLGLTMEYAALASVNNVYSKKAGLKNILKSHLKITSEGQLTIQILDGQESFKIKPLLRSNSWAIVDESIEQLNKNDKVEFYPNHMNWE
ncbi:molybdopterin molybdotransferase MoeA [Aliikangiella marina]|uniref:Molybdopterin molybdenumtransferase n=1 Tax=Aliikangiella marina TaxID=1712262 RepID=A0A545TJY9_9GAMM|nr:molybdopterin molybdotransferase MoeA [Aliikangiella marina]TQV77535.1 molybdopterin molybdotransferase MoeA [Aliikangiella marina]